MRLITTLILHTTFCAIVWALFGMSPSLSGWALGALLLVAMDYIREKAESRE